MGQYEGFFEGAETFWPLNCPGNFGVKKVVAPSKNPENCPIMSFAQENKIISPTFQISGTVLYTEGWVCDVALIEYTLGPGETQEGLGF